MDFSRRSSPAFEASERRWHRHGLARRLWSRDPGVWSHDVTIPDLADRLGWLRLHETMPPELIAIRRVADDVISAGTTDIVLCGMGGSSLAPEVFASTLGEAGDGLSFHLLDSTHPEAVAAVRESIDPATSVFVISSKSGSTLETLSFFRFFWAATGGDGSRFLAITDPGSGLERLGHERGFRHVVNAFPDIGGRFSALSHFGLVPAAMIGIDIERLLGSAARMASEKADSCIEMGLSWGSSVLDGVDKLHVHTSPSLAAFPAWLEQLVAESLGKEGTGLLPLAGASSTSAYDRSHLRYRLAGEQVDAESGPLIELADEYELGGEMLRAEVATAVAGEILGVNPFDQPNVEAAKVFAREAMSSVGDRGEAEFDNQSAIGRILSGVESGDYVAIHAYLPPGPELEDGLEALRSAIEERTGASVSLGWGPRFLHSTGQFHKGGPNSGVFIQLVDEPALDLEVPESDRTFGQIVAAQARGDLMALRAGDRRAVSVSLGAGRLDALGEIVGSIW